jgi:hypothetical protein
MYDVTRLLEAAAAGDRRAADDLLPVGAATVRPRSVVRLSRPALAGGPAR